jgi:hypothetical protein
MKSEHVQWNKDDLPHIRGHQQNYENFVPHRLSLLYDPLGPLREQIGTVGQNTEDGSGDHDHSNGQKHPCPPPVKCASRHKQQESEKHDVEDNTSNDFGNRHRVFRK